MQTWWSRSYSRFRGGSFNGGRHYSRFYQQYCVSKGGGPLCKVSKVASWEESDLAKTVDGRRRESLRFWRHNPAPPVDGSVDRWEIDDRWKNPTSKRKKIYFRGYWRWKLRKCGRRWLEELNNFIFFSGGEFPFKSPRFTHLGDNGVVGHLVARATWANILIHRINIAITIAEKRERKRWEGREEASSSSLAAAAAPIKSRIHVR